MTLGLCLTMFDPQRFRKKKTITPTTTWPLMGSAMAGTIKKNAPNSLSKVMMLLHDGPLCYFLKIENWQVTLEKLIYDVSIISRVFSWSALLLLSFTASPMLWARCEMQTRSSWSFQRPEQAKTVTFALRCVTMHEPKGVRRMCVCAFK